MTTIEPDDPWGPSEPSITHPDHPLVGDDSAALIEAATVELTLLRSPLALGDGLADLHALVSLAAQLNAWIPITVFAARRQHHSWAEIAAQLEVTPATAKRPSRAPERKPGATLPTELTRRLTSTQLQRLVRHVRYRCVPRQPGRSAAKHQPTHDLFTIDQHITRQGLLKIGEQRCECGSFMRRLGRGGLSPCCLLTEQPMRRGQRIMEVKGMALPTAKST